MIHVFDQLQSWLHFVIGISELWEFFVVGFEMVVVIGVDDFLKFLFLGLKFLIVKYICWTCLWALVFVVLVHLVKPWEFIEGLRDFVGFVKFEFRLGLDRVELGELIFQLFVENCQLKLLIVRSCVETQKYQKKSLTIKFSVKNHFQKTQK